MENNLSAPLSEISEKLTTISEEVKEPQKEDRPISTGNAPIDGLSFGRLL